MAAAGKMTASFILKLEDQLSGGLNKLQAALDKIFAVAKKLKFDGLEQATAKIDGVTQATGAAATKLDKAATASGKFGKSLAIVGTESHQAAVEIQAIGRAADSTAFKLGRMTAAAGAKVAGLGQRIGVVGGAVAGFSLIEPVRHAAEIDNILRHQAIYGGKTGADIDTEVARLRLADSRLAIATARPFHEVAEAGFYLQQSQMSPATVDALLNLSAQAATAYNANTLDVAKTAFSLHENLNVPEADIGQGLGIIGTAAKLQHFQFSDYAQNFPEVATVAALKGINGVQGVTDLAAMLVTGRAGAATPGMASTNLVDFISSLSHKNTRIKFAELGGGDLEKLMADARKKGLNPLEAVLMRVRRMQAGHPDIDVIGHLFQNIQTQQFVGQITSHVQDYLDAKKHITERASILTLAEDFKKSVHGLAGQMKLFDAIIEILITRLGNGFAPVVNRVGRGLVQVEEGFQWLDQHVPGLSNKIIEFAGVGLLAVAALAAIGIAAPAVAAGFMLIVDAVVLLATPVGAVLAALGLLAEAAWDVYDSWADFAPFFGRIWQATQHFFAGFLRFVAGVFSLDLQAAYDGLTAIWDGLAGYWFNLWGVIGRLFTDFTSFVDGWTGGAMAQAISNIKHEWDGLKAFFFDLWGQIRAPFDAFIDDFENSSVGRLMGLSSAPSDMAGATDGRKGDESYALPRRDDSGYIEIRFANPPPGLEATGSNSRFRFQPLNPLLGPAVGIQ